jgi:DNA uptake protein ComE-like DNA-binding protein
VSSGKYEQAVAEAEEAKVRADKIQLQKTVLEQEVKSLRDQKTKLTADADLAASELQRLKDSLDKERGGTTSRVRDLEQRSRDLATQNRALRQQYDSLRKQNESLKATVARYQKALKEPPVSPTVVPKPPTAPAAPGAPAAPPAPVTPPAPAAPAVPAPAAAPAPAAPAAGVSPVNVNKAFAQEMVLFLGITKEEADKIVAGRPYKVKQEILVKGVLPKPKFDAIKDRITVAQQ